MPFLIAPNLVMCNGAPPRIPDQREPVDDSAVTQLSGHALINTGYDADVNTVSA